jgi:hypothetical protein
MQVKKRKTGGGVGSTANHSMAIEGGEQHEIEEEGKKQAFHKKKGSMDI